MARPLLAPVLGLVESRLQAALAPLLDPFFGMDLALGDGDSENLD